jgi:hypothetical protein
MVDGRGYRAGAETDRPDVESRVAMDGDGRVHAVDHAFVDDVERAARRQLLGWLEHEANGARQRVDGVPSGQREDESQPDGRVRVMAAGVAGAGGLRTVVDGLVILDRQGVDIRTDENLLPARVADVTPQTRPPREIRRPESFAGELRPDELGGLELGPTELRMPVQPTTKVGQIVLVRGQPPSGDLRAVDSVPRQDSHPFSMRFPRLSRRGGDVNAISGRPGVERPGTP